MRIRGIKRTIFKTKLIFFALNVTQKLIFNRGRDAGDGRISTRRES